jgi:hypothetical protein
LIATPIFLASSFLRFGLANGRFLKKAAQKLWGWHS